MICWSLHSRTRGVALLALTLLAAACTPPQIRPLALGYAAAAGSTKDSQIASDSAEPINEGALDPTRSASPYGVNGGTLYEPTLSGDPAVMTSKLANAAQQTGVGWIRLDVDYGHDYQKYGAGPANASIDSARVRGLAVLRTLRAPPTLDMTSWRTFVEWAVAQFGNRVQHWSVLNEPNCEDYFELDGTRYDAFVREASLLIRNAGGKVVLGEWSHSDCAGTEWLFERLANVGSLADVVSMHKYGTVGEIAEAAKSTAREVRIRIGKPMWLTEFGFQRDTTFDELQRHEIDLVLRAMGTPPADGLGWQKSFVYHLHNDALQPDYRIFNRSDTVSAGATVTPRAAVSAVNLVASDCPVIGTSCLLIHRYAISGNHFFTADTTEMSGLGYTRESSRFIYLATQPTSTTGAALAPLYECWSQSAHFVTRSAVCDLNPNAINDRTLGYVATTQAQGTVPLYRLYRASNTDDVATTCTTERSALLSQGYTDRGILGYVWRSRTASASGC